MRFFKEFYERGRFVRSSVFKGESVRRNVFMALMRSLSLEALRHKPFVIILHNL